LLAFVDNLKAIKDLISVLLRFSDWQVDARYNPPPVLTQDLIVYKAVSE